MSDNSHKTAVPKKKNCKLKRDRIVLPINGGHLYLNLSGRLLSKSSNGMISSSNFVEIARLVVLVRKDPGTTSPFSSLLDPLP